MSRPNWDEVWLRVAGQVAERSLCEGDRVGAVIASSTNRIVAVGYNNPPAGFDHQGRTCVAWCDNQRRESGYEYNWESSLVGKSRLVTTEFTSETTTLHVEEGLHEHTYVFEHDDPTAADQIRHIMHDCGYRPVFPGKKDSNVGCPTLHAEANALSVCDRSQREGGTIYVTSAPCFSCAKLITNSGLTRVVYRDSERGRDRTRGSEVNPLKFMHDAGIKVMMDDCIDCGDGSSHPYASEDGAC
jgi:deoxycytidylate deaminase